MICHDKIQILSKNWECKIMQFFFILENVIFSPKLPVFSLPVHDTGLKVKNSDPPTKVTYTMLELS